MSTIETTASASSFASVAKAFCAWCEGSTLGPEPDAVAASWLAKLYAAALLLPDVAAENADGPPSLPEIEVARVKDNLACFNGWYYKEYFDPNPTLDEASVIGDVGDDLLDTYRDIKTGYVLFESGQTIEALWHWRFLYRVHWGRHAVAALFAIHTMSISRQ